MLQKIKNGALATYLKAKNKMYNLVHEEKGAAEIVAIMLVIVILIAVVIVFRDQLKTLITNVFKEFEGKTTKIQGDPTIN